MKKLILGSAIAAVLGVASSAMAAPNTGTVNFTGSVSTATCDLSLKDNNGADISSINLGVLSSSATTNGTAVPFKLVPTDNACLTKASANVAWSSPTLAAAGINNATNGGTNAYLLLSATNANQTGNNALIKQGQTSFDYSAQAGIKSFDYSAVLAKPTAALTAGPFSASASYIVTYK